MCSAGANYIPNALRSVETTGLVTMLLSQFAFYRKVDPSQTVTVPINLTNS